MWFTIAFFSIPVALFLFYRGLTEYSKNGKTEIVWAVVLVLIPIILAVIEIGNTNQINEELIGTYYSDNDTLILRKDKTFSLKSIDSLVIGQWELEMNDKLIVNFSSDGKKFIKMGLTYVGGLPFLESDPYHLENTNSRRYERK